MLMRLCFIWTRVIYNEVYNEYNFTCVICFSDSLIFAIRKDTAIPLELSGMFHAFKDELPGRRITKFNSIGITF